MNGNRIKIRDFAILLHYLPWVAIFLLVFMPMSNGLAQKVKIDSNSWHEQVKDVTYQEKIEEYNAPASDLVKPEDTNSFLKLGTFFGYLLLILLIVVVIYFIAKNWKENQKLKRVALVDPLTDVEKPLSQLEKLWKTALDKKQYRLAVRFRYALLLRSLADKKYINLTKHKTNFDYHIELMAQPFVEEFKEVSTYFDYTWYGEREPGFEGYRDFHVICEQIIPTYGNE